MEGLGPARPDVTVNLISLIENTILRSARRDKAEASNAQRVRRSLLSVEVMEKQGAWVEA